MKEVEKIRTSKMLGVQFNDTNGLKKFVFGDSIDEIIDGLEILKDGTFVNEFMDSFTDLSEEQLNRLDKLMAKISDADEIAQYANRRKNLSNREDIENTLIKLNSAEAIVKYAQGCQVQNIDKLVDVIRKSGSAELIMKFVGNKELERKNLLKLKETIFQTNDIYEMIDFCNYCQKKSDIITQEDVQEVENLAINSRHLGTIIYCAFNVNGVNIEKIREIVWNAKSSKGIYNTEFLFSGLIIQRFEDKFGPNPNKKRHFFSRKK